MENKEQQEPKFKIEKTEDYIKFSEATLSENYFMDRGVSKELYDAIEKHIQTGKELDRLKKQIFYTKGIKKDDNRYITTNKEEVYNNCLEIKNQKILHAGLGMATESVEILEQLHNSYKAEKDVDVVNIAEEIGDVMWYIAVVHREYKLDFNRVLSNNLNKLFKRFGDKFDSFFANNRDLDSERKELER